jgi:hypothetical protein
MPYSDLFLFPSICFGSYILVKLIAACIFPTPSKYIEAYGGCECGAPGCKKIDEIFAYGKRYQHIIQVHKMPYRYSKIYNVTQAAWAYNVAGGDDAKKVWADNDWEEGDALLGFYTEDNCEVNNVIYCRPGYAVYAQLESDKEKANFQYGDIDLRIPPAILVNLNNAYDTDFLHSKVHPSEEEDMSEEEEDDDEEDEEEEEHITTNIPENQRVIDFLYKCSNTSNNSYRRSAYLNAINEIHSYRTTIDPNSWKPCIIGSSIERKVKEFLNGVPEEDIINS